jgi:pyruvate dehydrogenase E2 component (dihydrolipoamide acetyltransferase)
MQIIMPKLGLTMTHGTITEWLKAPGDAVKAEEALCAYETEKVTLEMPAPEDGVLAAILVPAGTTVAAGTPVCEFLTKGEGQAPGVRRQESHGDASRSGVSNPQPSAPGAQLPASSNQLPVSGPLNATPKARTLARELGVDLAKVTGSGPDGRVQAQDVEAARTVAEPTPVKATPLARRIAASEGIDLSAIAGTGPEGMITREDVEAAIKGQGTGDRDQEIKAVGQPSIIADQASRLTDHDVPSTETILPLSSLRRTIADRMSASAFTAPHVTLFTEADASNLVSARTQLNEELPVEAKISYNALLAALVARALKDHPRLNSRLEPDGLHLLTDINIALAMDTERGLMTPVLHNVDALNLSAIQHGYNELAARALGGKSLPGDFDAGTFTITNLGALDIDGFTPIINPPQAAILGVGRIVEKAVARDGAVVVRPMMALSLSFDHRIVDGAPAARFLQRIKQLVERPLALLL